MWRKVLALIGVVLIGPPVGTLMTWGLTMLVGKITGRHSPMEQLGPGYLGVWALWQILVLVVILRAFYLYRTPSGEPDQRSDDKV